MENLYQTCYPLKDVSFFYQKITKKRKDKGRMRGGRRYTGTRSRTSYYFLFFLEHVTIFDEIICSLLNKHKKCPQFKVVFVICSSVSPAKIVSRSATGEDKDNWCN